MHAHGLNGSLVSWMIAGDGTAAEERRLGHLAALAESRAARPSPVDRLLARLSGRAPTETTPALDCCAVA